MRTSNSEVNCTRNYFYYYYSALFIFYNINCLQYLYGKLNIIIDSLLGFVFIKYLLYLHSNVDQ